MDYSYSLILIYNLNFCAFFSNRIGIKNTQKRPLNSLKDIKMIFQFSEKQPLRGHSVTKNRVTGLVTELVTNQLIKFDIN